ncbi:MAG TPA: branched-chain amino acid ABC transporter permease [Candidatus Deferrimicrobiaceae bacterium]|nr:branched-chain amino acid ABC transporter permease [Candidatus Deferrimicrobiaceae bacterium]
MDGFQRKATGALALGAGLLLLLPLAGVDLFLLDVLTTGFLLACYVGSWDIVGGVAGQISLGHALFFGTSTYACALLTSLAGWPFAAAAASAILLSTVAAAVVGTVSARLKGPFIALLTLALGELVHEVMLGQTFFSPREGYSWGGEGGVPVTLPWKALSPWAAYYLGLLFLFLAALGMTRIARSKEGLIWTAIAGSELTARASGVDIARHKRRAFLAAGALAGAAGVGFAAYVGRATSADFSLELSFQAATFSAIGGRGTIVGPVLTALALHAVLQGAGFPPAARVLLYALALLLTLRFFPEGVAGTLRSRLRARRMVSEGADR